MGMTIQTMPAEPAPAEDFPDLAAAASPANAGRRLSLRARFRALALHRRFALVGSLVSVIGMFAMGEVVTGSIEAGVVRNSAISSAVYMESFIAPLSQELAEAQRFSPETLARMRTLLESEPLADRVRSVKIWREGGLIAFASDPSLIGRRFPEDDALRAAWGGDLSATFDDLEGAESAAERETGEALFEVYNPIHSIVTGEVIAVAEFYLVATELRADLWAAKAKAWAMVALVAAATFAALFGIVRAGSRTIDAQTRALAGQLDDLARVSALNAALRQRVQGAAQRVSEMNERQMRRISAELHDGPAQALALASLRLDALMRRASVGRDDPEALALREVLDASLRDVRALCHGLTLPELEGLTLAQTLERSIEAHERRTGTVVERDVSAGPWPDLAVPHPILICCYRFVQEGLMNTFRHARGARVRVGCEVQAGRLVVFVSDNGPGFDARGKGLQAGGLGLPGLRERVESIGGSFHVLSAPGRGVLLSISLSLDGLP